MDRERKLSLCVSKQILLHHHRQIRDRTDHKFNIKKNTEICIKTNQVTHSNEKYRAGSNTTKIEIMCSQILSQLKIGQIDPTSDN